MEPRISDYFKSSQQDIMDEYKANLDYVISNPYLTQSQISARIADVKYDYEMRLSSLRDRIEQDMMSGSAQDTYSWKQGEVPMVELKSKKEINGKEAFPELYKLLKSRKSIHH
jgi:hypothetical protein